MAAGSDSRFACRLTPAGRELRWSWERCSSGATSTCRAPKAPASCAGCAAPTARCGSATSTIAVAGLLAGLCAILITPSAWAAQIFNPWNTESVSGSVGPSSFFGYPGGLVTADNTLTASQQFLASSTMAHRGSAKYLFATTSEIDASPYILDAGVDVLPMGGFTGQAPFPTPAQFRQLVSSGQLQYVLISDNRGMGLLAGGNGPGAASTTSPIAA
jgi:hypothetical protein